MKVVATKLGYYGLVRRKEGDVFEIEDKAHFSEKWMKSLEGGPVKEKLAEKLVEDFEKQVEQDEDVI